jgi:chorismate-pyruvate lyase
MTNSQAGESTADGAPAHTSIYVAQCHRPGGLKPVDAQALPPYHRSLLVMDGTLTHFVEAFHGEALASTGLQQEAAPLRAYDRWLDAPAGLVVLERQAILTGARTGTLYAYAESRIAVDRLPACLRGAIDDRGELLGRIMRACRAETYRELLWHGLEYPTELPEALSSHIGERFLTRAYQVIARGRPFMLITEKFPLPDADEHA